MLFFVLNKSYSNSLIKSFSLSWSILSKSFIRKIIFERYPAISFRVLGSSKEL